MHHADLEFDVTTGLRFHPVEVVLSMVIKIGVVAALGASAIAVLIFEVLLNATSMFNHSNIRLLAVSSAHCDGLWSHPTCIGFITLSICGRPTATSASTCLGGIACLAPIVRNRQRAMKA